MRPKPFVTVQNVSDKALELYWRFEKPEIYGVEPIAIVEPGDSVPVDWHEFVLMMWSLKWSVEAEPLTMRQLRRIPKPAGNFMMLASPGLERRYRCLDVVQGWKKRGRHKYITKKISCLLRVLGGTQASRYKLVDPISQFVAGQLELMHGGSQDDEPEPQPDLPPFDEPEPVPPTDPPPPRKKRRRQPPPKRGEGRDQPYIQPED